MQAGLLTERIGVYSIETSKSEFGGTVKSRSLRYETRAKVRSLGGALRTDAGESFAAHVIRCEMGHYHELSTQDSILWRGDWFRVISVDKVPALRRLTVVAERMNV